MEDEGVTNQYDGDSLDADEIIQTDVKINPDFYIHTALLKSQQALLNPSINEGFKQYRMFIEHIEGLCRASKIIDATYDEEIKKFEEAEKDEKDSTIKFARISNKKIELLMREVFNRKPIKEPMKL